MSVIQVEMRRKDLFVLCMPFNLPLFFFFGPIRDTFFNVIVAKSVSKKNWKFAAQHCVEIAWKTIDIFLCVAKISKTI